jgi:hypothetical protein
MTRLDPSVSSASKVVPKAVALGELLVRFN